MNDHDRPSFFHILLIFSNINVWYTRYGTKADFQGYTEHLSIDFLIKENLWVAWRQRTLPFTGVFSLTAEKHPQETSLLENGE